MDYTNQYPVDSGGFGIFVILYVVFILVLYAVTAAGLWKMYAKAGKPGWAAIIPLYNWWVWVDIIGRPRWWFWVVLASVLLSWIPLVGIALSIAVAVLYLLGCLDMAKCFGRGGGTGVGLWILPFVFAPLLGFGSAQFEGIGPSQSGSAWTAGMGTMGRTPAPASPAPPSPMMMAETPAHEFAGPASYPAPPAAPAMATAASMDTASMDMASPAPFATPPAAPQTPAAAHSPRLAPASPADPPPVWPPALDGPKAPYTLAPRSAPVAPLGSWPPAPASS